MPTFVLLPVSKCSCSREVVSSSRLPSWRLARRWDQVWSAWRSAGRQPLPKSSLPSLLPFPASAICVPTVWIFFRITTTRQCFLPGSHSSRIPTPWTSCCTQILQDRSIGSLPRSGSTICGSTCCVSSTNPGVWMNGSRLPPAASNI